MESYDYTFSLRAFRLVLRLMIGGLLVSLLIYFYQSLLVVRSGEKGVLLRLGTLVEKDGKVLFDPGTYFVWPYPIDEYYRVNIQKVYQHEVDVFLPRWMSQEGIRPLEFGKDGYHVTSDGCILHSRWVINYRINRPEEYLFRGKDGEKSVTRCLNLLLPWAVIQVSSTLNLDDAWRNRGEHFSNGVLMRLRGLVEQLNLGIQVEHLDFEILPPSALRSYFDQVTSATQERQRLITQAESEAQTLLSQAKLNASKIIAEATQEKNLLLAISSGDIQRFRVLYKRYKSNPDLFRQVYVLEMLENALEYPEQVVLLTPKKGQEIRIWLDGPGEEKRDRSDEKKVKQDSSKP